MNNANIPRNLQLLHARRRELRFEINRADRPEVIFLYWEYTLLKHEMQNYLQATSRQVAPRAPTHQVELEQAAENQVQQDANLERLRHTQVELLQAKKDLIQEKNERIEERGDLQLELERAEQEAANLSTRLSQQSAFFELELERAEQEAAANLSTRLSQQGAFFERLRQTQQVEILQAKEGLLQAKKDLLQEKNERLELQRGLERAKQEAAANLPIRLRENQAELEQRQALETLQLKLSTQAAILKQAHQTELRQAKEDLIQEKNERIEERGDLKLELERAEQEAAANLIFRLSQQAKEVYQARSPLLQQMEEKNRALQESLDEWTRTCPIALADLHTYQEPIYVMFQASLVERRLRDVLKHLQTKGIVKRCHHLAGMPFKDCLDLYRRTRKYELHGILPPNADFMYETALDSELRPENHGRTNFTGRKIFIKSRNGAVHEMDPLANYSGYSRVRFREIVDSYNEEFSILSRYYSIWGEHVDE